VALHQSGQLVAAEAAYRAVLAAEPAQGDAWNNLGLLLHATGKSDEALTCLQQATRLQPENPRAWGNLGVVLKKLGQLDAAADAQRQALRIAPDFAAAHNNLGNLLHAAGDIAAAKPHFAAACRLEPGGFEHQFMLGKCLLEERDFEGALAALHKAHRIAPDNADCLGTIARVWLDQLRLPEALAAYDEGMACRPDYDPLRYNRGLARLVNGDLLGGFADYESRWQVPDFPSKRLVTEKPDWDGQAMPQGTLLLHAEQGLGDTLQMLRYLPQVAAKFAKVWLLIQAPLRGLVQLPANVSLLADGQKFPPYDVVCPLLSLPHRFATDILAIPTPTPYLDIDPERQAHWRQRLANSAPAGTRKIGLTWAGNPSHRNDANRSLPFAHLLPLLKLPGIQWVALQVGNGREQLAQHPEILDLGPELKDFSDTAAVLEQLDLLISVDTSIVHLAGALGLPAWLLLPQVPDWRWLLDRDDSPWYPSLTILRQTGHDQWPELIERVRQRLQQLQAPAALAAAEQSTEAGRAQLEQKQAAAAERQFWRAVRQRPWHGRAMSGLAVLAWKQNRPAAALVFGARACRLDPDNPEAWSNYGAYLKAGQRYEEALFCQQQALKLAPDNPTALSNLGNLLGKLERWQEARQPAERALALAPQVADFHYNAGIVFKELGEFERALHHLRQAQSLAGGEHVKARLHEAMVLLLQGDFAAGWPAYESRWQQPDCKEKHSFACPLWQGEDLTGKTILLYSEQGLGDSFQFMRYAPLVAERAGRTLLVVQPEVEALARRMPGKHEVFASGAPLPDYDFHCPLLSLPLVMRTTLANVPADVPYLRVDAARQAAWTERLHTLLPAGKRRIGLVWAGRPTHGNDHNRSMKLQQFSALLALPDIAWVALQKGPALAETAALPAAAHLTVLDAELRDFDDTAAVLSQLDALVTVDTSVAHLAGALGVPTWVMLPQLPDWRWMWQRSDSPWYPSFCLLRQNRRGDWGDVLRQLQAAVAPGKTKTKKKGKGK